MIRNFERPEINKIEEYIKLWNICAYFNNVKENEATGAKEDNKENDTFEESKTNILQNEDKEMKVNNSIEYSNINILQVDDKENKQNNTIKKPKINILQNIIIKKGKEDGEKEYEEFIEKGIGSYLSTPVKPKRKNKRITERLPYAITSKQYQNMKEEQQKKLRIKKGNKKKGREIARKRNL